MSTFYKHDDKQSGDGLAITDWNELSKAVAGNQGLHLALDADAKVGIGTTSPSAKLEVNGNTKVSGELYVNSQSNSVIHYGNRGKLGQAEDFNPDVDHNGLWIEASDDGSECGGIFMNGNTMSIWSPGDNDLLRVYDEDIITGDPKFKIDPDGNVGIGTTNPKAKLDVTGGSSNASVSSYGYLNKGGAGGNYSGSAVYTEDYSIYASGRIIAQEFSARCDERIKKVMGISNAEEDLNTLLQIQITDYSYKDPIIHGEQPQKKVLGQQIAKVYPQAVTCTQKEIVPDVMRHAIADGHGSIQLKNHGLSINDKVQILYQEDDKDKQEIFVIKEVEEDCFKVDFSASGEVFIYGREIDDFHVVDIDALSMLNISATQALACKIKKIDVLQQEVNILKEKNMLLNDRLNAIEEKLGLI